MAKRKQASTSSVVWVVRLQAEGEANFDDIPEPEHQYWAAYQNEAEAFQQARILDREEIIAKGTNHQIFPNSFADATTFPEYAFRDLLLEQGVPLPQSESLGAWRQWWNGLRQAMRAISRDQFLVVLEALNKMPLCYFEVVAVPCAEPLAGTAEESPDVGYAVVLKCWEFGDDFYYGSNEALHLYRTREEAEAEIQRRGERVFQEWNGGPNEYVIVELPWGG